MAGVELTTGACDGHVVVALRGELDVTGAPEAAPQQYACRVLALTGQDEVFRVQANVDVAVAESSLPGRTH
jgi:hypothetical protein